MAEYTNDDDRELWRLLPSDIFPVDQEVSEPKHNNSSHDQQFSCMAEGDLLAQSLATCTLSDPTPLTSSNQTLVTPIPNVVPFRYEVPCITIGSPPTPVAVPWWLVCNGVGGTHLVPGYGTGSVWPANGVPVYPYPFLIPIQTLAGGFGGERVEALQSRQNLQVPNQLPPLSGGGVGNGGGVVRNYGGTGVFLPRKPASISSFRAHKKALARKRQAIRSRKRDHEVLPQRDSTDPADMKEQEDRPKLLPPGIILPTE